MIGNVIFYTFYWHISLVVALSDVIPKNLSRLSSPSNDDGSTGDGSALIYSTWLKIKYIIIFA